MEDSYRNIIIDTLTSHEEYPFKANDVWSILNYTRKDIFIRAIKNDTTLTKKDYGVIKTKNIRSSNDIALSKIAFLRLLCIKYPNDDWVHERYIEFRKSDLTRRLLHFEKRKGYNYSTWDMKEIICYYRTYELTTYQIAKDLGIDSDELFKFTNQENISKSPTFERTLKKKTIYGTTYWYHPSYSFNVITRQQTYEVLELIKLIIEKFPLDSLQKELAQLMYEGVDKLIIKQLGFFSQHRAEAEYKRKKRQKVKVNDTSYFLSSTQKDYMKKLYRKASKLCHPDRNPEGEALFKSLSVAYNNNDLRTVENIYNKLKN